MLIGVVDLFGQILQKGCLAVYDLVECLVALSGHPSIYYPADRSVPELSELPLEFASANKRSCFVVSY
jgi:hypothetical protein